MCLTVAVKNVAENADLEHTLSSFPITQWIFSFVHPLPCRWELEGPSQE